MKQKMIQEKTPLALVAVAVCLCLGAGRVYGDDPYEEIDGIKWYYSVTDDVATITDVSSHVPNDLVVPATLGGNPVVTIGRAVFSYAHSNLTSITFPDSLREIVEKNFDSSPNLTNVTFGTGMEVLGYDVFADKTRILQFTIPEGNPNFSSEGGILYSKDKTTLVRYAESATAFEIPGTVTVIGEGAFYYHDLTNVTFHAGILEIRDNAFACNFKLAVPALPSGLTVIGEAAFRSCYETTGVVIPDGVSKISSEAFNYCDKLSSLTIGAGVGEICDYAFGTCTSLVSVVIPSCVTNINGDAFVGCTSLSDVTIGSGVAIMGTPHSTFVDDWGYEYLKEAQPAFGSCNSLMNFKLADGNATFEEIGGCLYFRDTPKTAKKLAAYPSGRETLYFTGDVNVTELAETSCSRCDKFVDITIPDTVREIGPQSMIGCASLEKLTIPAGPTNISEGAFMVNMALYDVEVAGTVKAIGMLAFQHANMDEETEGRRLLLHEGIESIGAEAFSRGRWVQELVVPNSVTYLAESAFAEQWMLKSAELGTGVTALPAGLLGGCYELESVTLNGAVASVGDNAFTGCEKLVGITLDNAATIGENAFNRCENLVRVDLGVNLTSVGKQAFQYCYDLPKVILPPNVAEVGEKAFDSCSSLAKAYLPAALEGVIDTAVVFSNCPKLGAGGIVFYGAGDAPYATVTLNANGGKCIGVDSVLRGEGDTLGTLPTAAYEGNTFDGWFTAAEGGEAVTAETPVAGDATYYAHWTGATPPEPPPVDPDGIAINTESSYTTESDGTFTLVLPIVSATTPKVTVKGLPSGVTFTANTLTIAGKAKAPGVSTVTISATNAKVKTPVTATFTLTVPNFTTDTFKAAGLDTDGKYVLGAGAAPDLSGVIQNIKTGGWKLAAAGLPAGLKYDDKNSAITGVATKEGVFTVTFTATKGKTKEVATATFEVVFPALTLDIAAYGEDASATNKAKVAGGGKYPVGAKVTLKATPDKGKVFAGWFDAEGNPLAGAADYRTASFPCVATDADVTLTAKFATEVEDIASLKVTLSDAKTDDDGTYELDLGACVESASLPKLAVKGLPTGLKFDAKTLKITGKATKPGVYLVKVEATNTSVKKATPASTGEFELKVPNFTTDTFKAAGLDTDGKYVLAAGVLPDDIANVVNAVVAGGWTLKIDGLPAGVKFDAKKNVFSGVATKEGFFTVTFTAMKGSGKTAEKEVATATFEVAYPMLALEIAAYGDETATNKCKVAGGGKYAAGAKVTLKATPDKGKVFAGWFDAEGNPLAGAADYRTASYAYVATDADVTLTAKFATEAEDIASLKVTVTDDKTDDDGAYELDLGACVASASLPKLAVKGLPTGLKFDTKTLEIAGKATKPGVYLVKVEATNTSVKKATPASTGEFKLTVPNFTCAALPNLKPETDAYGTNFAGVAFDPALVDCTPAEGWTVKVAGLPTGLKYDAKTGKIAGVSTAKPGSYTVTFTATKGKEKQEATITLNVAALPDWAVGTFDGAVDGDGIVQALTIAANGKISGKVLEGGNTWTLSAASFDSYDAGSGAYLATVVGKNGKLLATNFVAITEGADGTGVASCGEWTAYQNLWKRTDTKASMPVFKKNIDVETDNGLKLTFKKDGAVAFAGTVDGAKVSGSSQLVWNGEGWKVTLYAPPKGTFDGYCETCAVTLTLDDANVVAAADVQAGAEPPPPAWGVGHYVGYGQVEHPPATLNGPSEYLWGMVYVDVAEDFSFTGSFAPFSGSPAPFSGKMYRVQVTEDIFGYLADDVAISVNGDDALLHFQFITMGFGKMGVQSTQCTPGITGISFFDVLHNPWGNAALASEISTFAPGASKTINLKDYRFYDSTEGDYVDGDSLTFQFAADGTVTITGQIFGAGVNSTTTIGVNDTIDDGAKFDCHVTFAANGRIYQLMVEIPSSGTVTSDDIDLYYDPDFPTDPNYHFGLINGW